VFAWRLRLARFAARSLDLLAATAIRILFAFARALGPERAADLGGFLARNLGPLFPAHRTARDNIRRAFPGIGDDEVKRITHEAWDNLGRTAAEYAHLDTLINFDPDNPDAGNVEISGIDHFEALRDDGKPGIIFAGHFANWELPAICAARYGLEATAVFRAPNAVAVAKAIHEVRSQTMGGLEAARQGAAFAMQGVLERGGHLGMLIDQHFTRGVIVDFMGRPALTNPVLAKFAKRFECPVHGVRVVRLPGRRFRLELTPPLDLPRDANGEIDVPGAMQAMTRVVEGWLRENPEQWLWMHRRWRPKLTGEKPES